MRLIAPTIIASFVLVAAAQGQVPKDAQSSYEPRSAPGAGQKYLEKFAGDWEVSKVFYPRTGDPVRSAGHVPPDDDPGRPVPPVGLHLRPGGAGSRPGLGIIGFEPETKRFTSFWVDSRQTRMSARQSREPFDGEKIVLYSLALDPDAKESRRSKTISKLEDNGRKLIHRQFTWAAAARSG